MSKYKTRAEAQRERFGDSDLITWNDGDKERSGTRLDKAMDESLGDTVAGFPLPLVYMLFPPALLGVAIAKKIKLTREEKGA